MPSMNAVISQARSEIIPSRAEIEEFNRSAGEFLQKLKKISIASFILGGSGAKGTWLKEEFDVDVFAVFPYSYAPKTAELSNILEPYLKKYLRVQRVHGSRDYFEHKAKGTLYEIIPILRIRRPSQAKNLTDISPLHVKWVKKHKSLQNEIRLVKAFMKASRVYGAESYISGFSGYVAEILTIHYGSFKNLIRGFPKIQKGDVIDVSKWFKSKRHALQFLNQSKVSPLIILDPVQKERNAAAALNERNIHALQNRCRDFMENPSIDFFKRKKITPKDLAVKTLADYRKAVPCFISNLPDKRITVIQLTATLVRRKHDIAASKLEKALDFIVSSLKRQGFTIYHHHSEYEKRNAHAWIVADPSPLSPMQEIPGPPLHMKHHVSQFKRKHKHTFRKANKLFAGEKRAARTPQDAIKPLLKERYVKERVASLTLL